MKHHYYLLFFVGLLGSSFLEAQQVLWQKDVKTSTQDFLSHLTQTIDGQFLVSGSSIQNKSDNQQPSTDNQNNGYDYHVMKLNQQGQTVWEKYFSGNGHDFLTAAMATREGGFLLAGTSFSAKGLDKKDDSYGGSDIWVLKINENGDEEWQTTLGKETDEEARSVVQTADFGYIVAGNVNQAAGGYGSKDVWLVKLNEKGNPKHQILLGGTGLDEVEKLIATKDGGCLAIIYSRSNSMENGVLKMENGHFDSAQYNKLKMENEGNVSSNTATANNSASVSTNPLSKIPMMEQPKTTENYGEGDYWIVKLDKDLNPQWQKNYGGEADDHVRQAVESETGYVIAGESRSNSSGNKKEGIKEGTDLWVLALDGDGNEQWQKSFNFGNRDVMMSLKDIKDVTGIKDKGFLLGGYTQTEVKAKENDETFWLLYLNPKGEEVWRKYVEGNDKQKEERLAEATLNNDGTYTMAGTAATELGKENWKILKIGDAQVEQLIEKQDLKIYPNPVGDFCYVEIGVDFKEATINVYDMGGKQLQSITTKNKVTKLNTTGLIQGMYIVTVNANGKKLNSKIVKK